MALKPWEGSGIKLTESMKRRFEGGEWVVDGGKMDSLFNFLLHFRRSSFHVP